MGVLQEPSAVRLLFGPQQVNRFVRGPPSTAHLRSDEVR